MYWRLARVGGSRACGKLDAENVGTLDTVHSSPSLVGIVTEDRAGTPEAAVNWRRREPKGRSLTIRYALARYARTRCHVKNDWVTKLVIAIAIVMLVASELWHSVTVKGFSRFWHDLVERRDGPMSVRFYLRRLWL